MLRFIPLPRYASRPVAFALLAGLCWALLAPRASEAKFQTKTATPLSKWTASTDGEDTYVLYKNERGETTCRPATKAERDQINSRHLGGPTRVIYPGAPRERDDTNAIRSLESTTGLNLLPSAGLRIVLHGTREQLENNQDVKEFYLGLSLAEGRRNFRDVKHYRRRKRWLG